MRYLKLFEHKNENLYVYKDTYGWGCKFKNSLGKGRALIMDNDSPFKSPVELKEGEMFLFGIETTPSNKGIGKIFLNQIFDYFNIDKIYLPSDSDHPVWNKIATKTDITVEMGSKDSTIFSLTKDQLNHQ